MTSKKLEKYLGHRVRIEMHTFKHSVEMVKLEGTLYATKGTHAVARDGCVKTYEHLDFYVDVEKSYYFIDWNQVNLIDKLNDLGEIEHAKI